MGGSQPLPTRDALSPQQRPPTHSKVSIRVITSCPVRVGQRSEVRVTVTVIDPSNDIDPEGEFTQAPPPTAALITHQSPVFTINSRTHVGLKTEQEVAAELNLQQTSCKRLNNDSATRRQLDDDSKR